MGAPSNRTATLESQMIPMIQDVPGQTLRARDLQEHCRTHSANREEHLRIGSSTLWDDIAGPTSRTSSRSCWSRRIETQQDCQACIDHSLFAVEQNPGAYNHISTLAEHSSCLRQSSFRRTRLNDLCATNGRSRRS